MIHNRQHQERWHGISRKLFVLLGVEKFRNYFTNINHLINVKSGRMYVGCCRIRSRVNSVVTGEAPMKNRQNPYQRADTYFLHYLPDQIRTWEAAIRTNTICQIGAMLELLPARMEYTTPELISLTLLGLSTSVQLALENGISIA